MPRRPLIAMPLAAFLIAAAPFPVLAGEEAAQSVRGSAEARQACARDFIAMLNTGTIEAVKGFEDRYASEARRGRASDADRLEQFRRMKQSMGRLTIERTAGETGSSLSVVVTCQHEPPHLFEFRFVEGDRLDIVLIQPASATPPRPLTPESRASAIEGTLARLSEKYVFPDVAEKMAASVRARAAAGEYDGLADEIALADRLTADLQAVSKDKHLRVRFAPEEESAPSAHHVRPATARQGPPGMGNHGFVKAEILPGNIGYIRLDGFSESEEARAPAAAAIDFVRRADALIFDMRYNGGGSPAMIRFLSSYLFDTRTHLNSFKDRDGETVDEFWTLDDVPGGRLPPGLPVYVLTSSRTFSGAEEFTYNLKNLGRATIIGETTGGGAHPVRGERVNDRFVVTVPYMRAWNPITKTNWEGTGVEPDVKTPAPEALDRAIEMARTAGKKE